MNSKTKFTLIVTAMVMVTLIAVVSIIAVFAARTQNFSSNVSVKYTATQITGKVSAKYYVGPTDTSGTAMTTTGLEGGSTELVFRPGSQALDPNTLNPLGDIVLDVEDTAENIPDKSWVVFEYVFQNGLGTPVSTDYEASLSFSGDAENIKITTAESNEQLQNFADISMLVSTPKQFSASVLVEHKAEDDYVNIKYFYVKAEIADTAKNSTFSGDFVWNLEYSDEPAPTLDKLDFTLMGSYYMVRKPSYEISGEVVIPSMYTGEDGVARPVTEMALYAFANCDAVTSVIMGNNIKRIDAAAFSNCSQLTNVVLGENVEYLENSFMETSIFDGCNSLQYNKHDNGYYLGSRKNPYMLLVKAISTDIATCEIHPNTKLIYEAAFSDCQNLTSIEVPQNVIYITETAFMNCGLTNLVVNDQNQKYTSRDNSGNECNVIIEKETKTIIAACNSSTIPTDDSVENIGRMAFSGVVGISDLVIPGNVKLGAMAFAACGLTSITINSPEIGGAAFAYCVLLNSVTIGENVTNIEMLSFTMCQSLSEVIIDSSTVCGNLIAWEESYSDNPTGLLNASTIRAKQEVVGLEEQGFTKSLEKEGDYWVYTKNV